MSRSLTALALLVLMFAAAFVPLFAHAQTTAPLVVENAWVRMPPGVDTAAVYFVLKNKGAKPVTVVGVSSPLADHVMVHETSTVDGQSRMRMREQVTVTPGKSVAFAPEGLHVMLSGLKHNVAVGDTVPLTLQLAGGGKLSVSALVRPLDAK